MLLVVFAALVAFLIGLAFLMYGYRLFLVMLPIWGFFALAIFGIYWQLRSSRAYTFEKRQYIEVWG